MPKFYHAIPLLQSLLKSTNVSLFNISFSLTYKILTTAQPSYHNKLISVQPPNRTRSSSIINITRPSSSSSLKITDRSFRYTSLWYTLQPRRVILYCFRHRPSGEKWRILNYTVFVSPQWKQPRRNLVQENYNYNETTDGDDTDIDHKIVVDKQNRVQNRHNCSSI